MVNDKLWWHVARSGGIVAWGLLAASVLLGLLLSSRVLGRRASAPWMLAVHRWVSGLALVFTGVHVAGLLLDDWVTFTWVDVVVPFASDWRPAPVAWGVLAMELGVALQLTSLLKARMSHRTWRHVHHLAGPTFLLGTLHFLAAGSDATRPAVRVVVVVVTLATVFLALVRAWSPGGRFPRVGRSARARQRSGAEKPLSTAV